MRTWLAGCMVLAACGDPEPDRASSRTALRIVGSDAITHRLAPALGASYEVGHQVEVQVRVANEADAMRALLEGRADLAATTRPAMPIEIEQAKALGIDLDAPGARHIAGVDAVAVSVHPRNPTDSLTYDQIVGIFCTRSIDNWSYLGLDDRPIRAVVPDAGSGTRALFEDFFCGPKGLHPRVEVLPVDAIATALGADPTAISFLSMTEGGGKVLGLRPDAGGQPIRPTQQNITRGSYPLSYDLYLFSRGAPSGPTKIFLNWLSSPSGQEVVDEQRFVPLFLRPERMDEARPLRETIHFDQGEAAPNQRSAARLQLLVDELRSRAGEYRHIVLEGYTDALEPAPADLSQARAEAVRSLLQGELPGLYFEIIPRGAVNPIAPNDTPYGRLRNRRVQVYLAAEEAQREDVVVGG